MSITVLHHRLDLPVEVCPSSVSGSHRGGIKLEEKDDGNVICTSQDRASILTIVIAICPMLRVVLRATSCAPRRIGIPSGSANLPSEAPRESPQYLPIRSIYS